LGGLASAVSIGEETFSLSLIFFFIWPGNFGVLEKRSQTFPKLREHLLVVRGSGVFSLRGGKGGKQFAALRQPLSGKATVAAALAGAWRKDVAGKRLPQSPPTARPLLGCLSTVVSGKNFYNRVTKINGARSKILPAIFRR